MPSGFHWVLQWQITLNLLWGLQEQTLLPSYEVEDLNPDQLLRSTTQPCPVSWLGGESSSDWVWVVQPWEDGGLQYSPSAGSPVQMLCANPFLSFKMNFFFLGVSKLSTICCEPGRSNKVINALPRPTIGLFAWAFTRQQIIKQKFQRKLLLPVSKALSS